MKRSFPKKGHPAPSGKTGEIGAIVAWIFTLPKGARYMLLKKAS
jgi:hypothetical protein